MPRPTLESEYQRGVTDGIAIGMCMAQGQFERNRRAAFGGDEGSPVFMVPRDPTTGRIIPGPVTIIQDHQLRRGK